MAVRSNSSVRLAVSVTAVKYGPRRLPVAEPSVGGTLESSQMGSGCHSGPRSPSLQPPSSPTFSLFRRNHCPVPCTAVPSTATASDCRASSAYNRKYRRATLAGDCARGSRPKWPRGSLRNTRNGEATTRMALEHLIDTEGSHRVGNDFDRPKYEVISRFSSRNIHCVSI